MAVRKPIGEFRAYVFWNGHWRHAYLVAGIDQLTILGEPVRTIEFKLTKNSKVTFTSEKSNFHKKKPYVPSGKKGVAA